jgi:hypothetical protein
VERSRDILYNVWYSDRYIIAVVQKVARYNEEQQQTETRLTAL